MHQHHRHEHRADRSTRRWIGAFFACADSTRRTMRASVDSAPTAVVRTSSRPSPLTAPPVTRVAGLLGTGRLSPVISDSSTWLGPRDLAVDRDALARAHDHQVADAHLGDRHLDIVDAVARTRAVSGAAPAARGWLGGLALGARLQPLAQQHQVMTTAEASKYRCGSCRGPAVREQLVEAQAVAGAGAQRHQQVHVAGAGRSAFQPAR
jgi:hypothetical protein